MHPIVGGRGPTGVVSIIKVGGIMLVWLEHDSVALAILRFGIAAVELLTFTF
jgi:hypothetical protein